MSTETQKNLRERNAQYTAGFTQGHLALPPAKKYLVLTCMDARIDPAAAFGIDLGDAHVVRNAGAHARDGLRSIIISQQLLGTREVIVVKHTGCGMLTFSNQDAHSLVRENLGPRAVAEIGDLDFLPFSDLEAAVRDDVEYLKKSAAVLQGTPITGWVYEVESGKVRQVV